MLVVEYLSAKVSCGLSEGTENAAHRSLHPIVVQLLVAGSYAVNLSSAFALQYTLGIETGKLTMLLTLPT